MILAFLYVWAQVPVPNFSDPASVLAFLVGVAIPIAVAAVGRARWSAKAKALLNAGLTVLSTTLLTLWTADGWQWATFLSHTFVAYAINVATYYGLWKPSGTAQAVDRATG